MAKFADIIGQEQLKEHIQNAIASNKVSHAYIINGERNAGKEFIARIFAMTLQRRAVRSHATSVIPASRRSAIISLILCMSVMKSPTALVWRTSADRLTTILVSSLTAVRVRFIL